MTKRNVPAKAWKPGQSGNPAGRPRGTGEVSKLRAALAPDVPDILNTVVAAAKSGDMQAARIILERVLPPIKATEARQPLDLPTGSLTEQGRAVLASVASGDLAPSQGAQLLSAIGTLARVAEIDELSARMAALEASHGNRA